MNWAEFFHMGGYAYYVWSAWGLSLTVLLWQWLQPKIQRQRIINEIQRKMQRETLNSQTTANSQSITEEDL